MPTLAPSHSRNGWPWRRPTQPPPLWSHPTPPRARECPGCPPRRGEPPQGPAGLARLASGPCHPCQLVLRPSRPFITASRTNRWAGAGAAGQSDREGSWARGNHPGRGFQDTATQQAASSKSERGLCAPELPAGSAPGRLPIRQTDRQTSKQHFRHQGGEPTEPNCGSTGLGIIGLWCDCECSVSVSVSVSVCVCGCVWRGGLLLWTPAVMSGAS